MGLTAMLRRLGFTKNAPATKMDEMSAALHTSVVSILKDASPEERAELLDETLDQYREAVLDAAVQQSAFAKAKAAPPWAAGANDDADEDEEDDEDEPSSEEDDDMEDPEPEDEMDAKLKKQYDDRIAALQAQVAEQAVIKANFEALQNEVTTLRKADEDRQHIVKATELLGAHATPEEITQAAELIATGADTTLLAKLAQQRAVFAKAAMLTVEVGTSTASDATSPASQIAKAAAEMHAKHPTLTKEQAIAAAVTANPALYAATL